jgi:hypothetical protein
VNAVRGNEEYVHLKSLEDEFHYVESNMPPGHGGKPDLDDKEGQPRVESPRRPSGTPGAYPGEGEEYYDQEEGEEGKFGGMTEEEYEEARKKHQQQFYGNPSNNERYQNNGQFSDDMHSVTEERKESAADKNEENPYDFFDNDNPEEGNLPSSQPPTDPFLLTSKFTSAALSPDQKNLYSKYMKQQASSSRSRNFETEDEGENGVRNHSPSGNENKEDNDDYDQHVFLQEPISSLPNSNNSTMNTLPYSDPFDSSRKASTDSPVLPPLAASISDPIIPLSSSAKSLSNTTAFSQRSSYESLHEID